MRRLLSHAARGAGAGVLLVGVGVAHTHAHTHASTPAWTPNADVVAGARAEHSRMHAAENGVYASQRSALADAASTGGGAAAGSVARPHTHARTSVVRRRRRDESAPSARAPSSLAWLSGVVDALLSPRAAVCDGSAASGEESRPVRRSFLDDEDAPAGARSHEGGAATSRNDDSLATTGSGALRALEEDAAAATHGQKLQCPGDFDDAYRAKGMDVDGINGMMVVFNAGIGPMERDRAAATLQVQFEADGRQAATVILEDNRNPSVQAMLQLAPEGNAAIFHGQQRIGADTKVSGDVVISIGGGVVRRVVTWKHTGDDFYSSLSVKGGREASVDFKYTQAVVPQLDLGATLSAPLDGFFVFPLPSGMPKEVFWGVHGAWHNTKADTAFLAQLDTQASQLSARWWHAPAKNLQLGSEFTVKLGTLESTMQLGFNLGVGSDALSGGPSSTLRAYVASDQKVGLSWQHGTHSQFASTQMLTVVSGIFDHRNQDHQLGVQFQFMY